MFSDRVTPAASLDEDGPVVGMHRALAAGVRLLSWDMPPELSGGVLDRRYRLVVDGRVATPPVSVVKASLTSGGTRVFAVAKLPPQATTVGLCSSEDGVSGLITLSDEPAQDGDASHDARFAAQLDAEGAARLASLLLRFCANCFHLTHDHAFAGRCLSILGGASNTVALVPRLRLTARFWLYEGPAMPEPSSGSASCILSYQQVSSLPVPPRRLQTATGSSSWVIAPPADKGGILVLVGAEPSGVLCHVRQGHAPRLIDGLTMRNARLPGPVRDYVFASLPLLSGDREVEALLREMQLFQPTAPAAATSKGSPVAAAIDVLVGDRVGGVFVAGWLKDPHRLVTDIEVVSSFGERTILDPAPLRFPRSDLDSASVPRGVLAPALDSGFVAFMPRPVSRAPSLRCRIDLVLESGRRIAVPAPPQPAEAAVARNAVLGCVSPAVLTPALLAGAIAPAAAALHAAHLASRTTPDVVSFGTPVSKPSVSVIIPLYANLGFLRFQYAAFARDAAFAKADILFVLDSPEQRNEVEHLLWGLHALYGLPVRLAVQTANYGYSAANNAGAILARSRTLLFLNSDVIPDRPGWTARLAAALDTRQRVGAVGPKLLFEDDSIQHAGLCFGYDPQRGRWFNQHFHKGYPRDYPPANVARSTPGVTGACLMTRRSLFEAVGGFTEDYIIGDFEDSDLCLKLRAAGADIRYEPSVELYHLERQSIQLHAAYTRSVASEYNAWLHDQRWRDRIARLMAASWDGGTPRPAPRRSKAPATPVLVCAAE